MLIEILSNFLDELIASNPNMCRTFLGRIKLSIKNMKRKENIIFKNNFILIKVKNIYQGIVRLNYNLKFCKYIFLNFLIPIIPLILFGFHGHKHPVSK